MPVRPPRLFLHLLLLGAAFRWWNLGAWSLGLDEGATWSSAVRPTWTGTLLAEADHPPAWRLITRATVALLGDTEEALRAPAAALGFLSIWLAWLLGLRLLHPGAVPARGGFVPLDAPRARLGALAFAGLLALGPYFLERSQEAGTHALLLVEVLGLALLYLRWLGGGGRWTLAGYAALATLTIHTHAFAAWPLLGLAAHGAWLRWRRPAQARALLPFVLATLAAALLFVPWAIHLVARPTGTPALQDPAVGGALVALWRMGAGPGIAILDAPRAATREAAGALGLLEEAWPWIALTAALWFVPVVAGAVALVRRGGLASLVVCSLALPLGALLAASPFLPQVHERDLVFLAPWVALLAALGAAWAPRLLRPLLLAGLLALLGLGILAYHGPAPRLEPEPPWRELAPGGADPEPVPTAMRPVAPLAWLHHGHPYGREPWRDAHAFVAAHTRPGDLVCLQPAYLHAVWDYYDRDRDPPGSGAHDLLLLPAGALSPEEALEWFGPRLAGRRRIVLVQAHEEASAGAAWPGLLFAILGSYRRVGPIRFELSRGVRVYVFESGT